MQHNLNGMKGCGERCLAPNSKDEEEITSFCLELKPTGKQKSLGSHSPDK